MTAEAVAKALGGHRAGATWMARCPAHDDHDPSLSISDGDDGKVLVYCHAGCNQREVIAVLRGRGLWPATRRGPNHGRQTAEQPEADPPGRTETALALWQASQAGEGSPVETYLRSRGLILPVPASLRFHVGLKHCSGSMWPAMVGLVTNGVTGTPMGIHRTFLARDGRGKASVDPAKMMLGPCGGGVVRLGKPSDVLMIGEGIETCLSAMQATGYPAWAALSTSGLRSLDLPRDVRDVIVLADRGQPGEAAAQNCAQRWKREGRRVRIARPPQGKDFNDPLNPSTPVKGATR